MPKRIKELIMEKDTAYGTKRLQKAEPKRKRRSTSVKAIPEVADSSSYKNLFYGALAVVVLFSIFVLAMKLFAPKGTITEEAAKTSNATISLSPSLTVPLSPHPTHEKILAQGTNLTTEPTAQPTKSVQPTKNIISPTSTPAPTVTPPEQKPAQNPGQKQREYTVQKGDSLWTISEKEYNTGYNWTQIAQANNLSNPGMIFAGNKLVIPTTTPSPIAQANPQVGNQTKGGLTVPNNSPNAITGTTYTVQHGDDLWNIAVRAYGDGYKWTQIAQVNNLANPSLIHSGNVLTIPRG